MLSLDIDSTTEGVKMIEDSLKGTLEEKVALPEQKNSISPEPWCTAEEIADYLRLSNAKAVHYLVRKGHIPV